MYEKQPPQRLSPESGSIIYFIFVMIALFAALSYFLMKGSAIGTSAATKEQERLAATDIIEYANKINAAVKTLRIKGCSDAQISFENAVNGTESYVNPSAPTDKSCNVFAAQGGGMTYVVFEDKYLDSASSYYASWGGRTFFYSGHAIQNAGTPNADLIMYVNNLTKGICMAINRQLNVPNPSDAPPTETVTSSSGGDWFKGVYGGTPTDPIGDNGALLNQKTGCFLQSGPNIYQFFQLLVPQ